MPYGHRLRKLTLPAIAAAVVGISACGGDDPPAPPPPPDLEVPAPPETGGAEVPTPSSNANGEELIETVKREFRADMERSGLTESQVQCVLAKLESSISDEQLEEEAEAGSLGGFITESTEAIEACTTTLR